MPNDDVFAELDLTLQDVEKLRNMREGKQKRTATSHGVETPILSDDYIRMLGHYKLIARNVHPFGFETADGFNSELLLLERRG